MKIETNLYVESPSDRILEVCVDQSELAKSIASALKSRAKHLTIKGFRKGKAPAHVARQYLTDDDLIVDAVKMLLPRAYQAAIRQENLSPLGRARFDLLQGMSGMDVIFEARLQVIPQLPIEGYRAYRVEDKREILTSEQLDEGLGQLAQNFAKLKAYPKEQEADWGDLIVVDYTVFEDGAEVPNAGNLNYELVLDSKLFLPGFCENLLGMRASESRQFELTAPKDYSDDNLAGRTLTFKVEAKEVQQRTVPPLDDAFAREHTQSKSLKDLKSVMSKALQTSLDTAQKERVLVHIIKTLLEQIPPEVVPEQLHQGHIHLALRLKDEELTKQGMGLEEYRRQRGLSQEAYNQEVSISALIQARLEVLYRSIAATEELQLTKGEVNQRIKQQARQMGLSVSKLKKQLEEQDRYKFVVYQALVEKVRDFLFSVAQIVEPSEDGGNSRNERPSARQRRRAPQLPARRKPRPGQEKKLRRLRTRGPHSKTRVNQGARKKRSRGLPHSQ